MDAATPPARAGSPADEGDGYEPLRRAVRQAVAGEKIGREAMRALASGASKRSNRGLAIVLTTLTSLGFLGGLSAFHSDLGLPEAAMTKGLFPVGDPLRSIRFDGRLQSNGTILVRETVGFADGHGGSLPLAPPCPETAEAVAQCTRDVRVDWTPVEGQVDAPLLFVPVGAETAVVTYEVLGTVQAWSDVGIADAKLYPTNPRATHYNDTLSVDGTLRFPGPVGRGPLETHLHGAAATPVVRNEPAAIVLEALRLSGSEEPDGASAPPLWKGQARWWPLLQADVRGLAVAAGLAMRSSSSRLVCWQ